ncbi:MAG: PD-(D/E)XK nuclease family protein [Clostridium sp.]|nr:PD-(D/E)XK nuclease family protein [Clostridium sp.]
MERFLTLVARDLLKTYGTNLTNVEVVFPNKRAGLFMNQAFVELSPNPMWAPRYRTISELFRSLSDYELCDPIQAVCELYTVYAENVDNPEKTDRFYGWGEILLADFDDIDKHLADAHALFSNIQALKEMDESSFLTIKQEQALRHFFEGFSIEGNSRLKEKFLQMWNAMERIYTDYHRRLKDKGLLYEGALYRHVVEHLDEQSTLLTGGKTYVFVGFNVLNDVEQRLFAFLHQHNRARFYWDYDNYYVKDNLMAEAGTFIRENLKLFPNSLEGAPYDNLLKPKDITYIAASSENAQARYLPKWLQHNLTRRENETAVVLCDESLLLPVLHSIPCGQEEGKVKQLNVTMGYPLTDTPIYGFINALLDLQTEGYDNDEQRFRTEQRSHVEMHPYAPLCDKDLLFTRCTDNMILLTYLQNIVEQLAAKFREQNSQQPLQPLYNETLFQTHGILNRFRRLTEDGVLDVMPTTLKRLIRTVMESTTVPFHGEPATGLQVMGVLETRNLDFRHIVLLSLNEGKLPQPVSNTSFIPYNLREVFGLTTIKHKIAVYAFYFYRLIQRAEHITMLYNASSEGTGQAEMSRFMQQLLAETEFPIRTLSLNSTPGVRPTVTLQAEKTDEVMRLLQNRYDRRVPSSAALSPSALNTYLDCPLKFYYQYVARLRVRKDPADGLDAALFGTVFHASAENVYRHLTTRNSLITHDALAALLEHPEVSLAPFVDAAFRENVFRSTPEEALKYNGTLVVARNVILSYLKQLLTYDLRQTPFLMKEMEQHHEVTINVPTIKGDLHIRIGGIVDRMDIVKVADPETGELLDTTRIMDYKTGGNTESPTELNRLVKEAKDRAHYAFQTFLYAWIICHETKSPVMPTLFFVHKSYNEDYSPEIEMKDGPVTNFHTLMDDFTELLEEVLEEIFTQTIPFRQTGIPQICERCDLRALCGR